MREYVIYTDSCADLDPKMIQELGVDYQPLTFTLSGQTYANWADGRDLSFASFYERLRGGEMSSTSQVNVTEFKESFTPILDSGKDILYLGFSSGLSGTVNSGRLAAEELAAKYPDSKIVVVDTLAASLGQGLIVWHAVQLKRQGKSIDEVGQWAEDNKLNLAHWFTVDDLDFLKRGGRVSAASAFLGSMLNIKPVLHVDNEGHLIPMEKVRGRKQSLDALIDHMDKTAIKPEEQMVFISHGDCLEDAEYVADQIKKRFGTKEIYTNYIGPVIGSHAGPGTVALFFLGTER